MRNYEKTFSEKFFSRASNFKIFRVSFYRSRRILKSFGGLVYVVISYQLVWQRIIIVCENFKTARRRGLWKIWKYLKICYRALYLRREIYTKSFWKSYCSRALMMCRKLLLFEYLKNLYLDRYLKDIFKNIIFFRQNLIRSPYTEICL